MSNKNLQTYLFEEIKTHHFKSKSVMIEALMKLLEVGKDAVYRRLRCETILKDRKRKPSEPILWLEHLLKILKKSLANF